jgi:regulator of protease activity HflC (stomatin/prohibitin superfamily)
MEAVFGWLGSVMRWLGSFLPRMEVVNTTHAGVKFHRGKHVRAIGPGITWWWPLLDETMTYPVVRQSVDLPSQTLTTSDGKPVTVGAVVVYTVEDVLTALTKQWDLAETIQDLSMAAVCDFVTANDFEWINSNRVIAKRHLTKRVSEVLEEYGVTAQGAWLTDFAQTRVISVIGSASVVDAGEEE